MSADPNAGAVGTLPSAGPEATPGSDPTAQPGAGATNPEPGSAKSPTDEAREWQSRYGRDTHALRKYFGPNFDPLVVDDVLGKFNRAVANPEIKQALEGFWNTGKFEIPKPASQGTDDEDPYQSPTEKALLAKVEALEGALSELRGSSQTVSVATASDRMVAMANRFLAKYPTASGDEQRKFRETLGTRLAATLQKDPNALIGMNDEAFHYLALGVLDGVVPLTTLGQRQGAANGQARLASATDAPLRALTNGQEAGAPEKPSPNMARRQVVDLFRQKWAEASRGT